MYPYVTLLGRPVQTFVLAALLGLAACALYLYFRARRFLLAEVDITNSAALGLLGVFAGGKLLYALTALPAFIRGETGPLALLSGSVYYGGLFGFFGALALYARRYKLERGELFDFFAPAVPLFHAFGRVGCFLNGCCHGIISETLGVAFTHSQISPNGVPFLPVQLIEAACELAIFAAVALYERRHRGEGLAARAYLALYAAARFALEFLRGDAARGLWGPFSTSQWISLAALVYLVVSRARRKRREGEGEPH